MTGREQMLRELREQIGELRRRYGVRALSLFGSAARGELGEASDVDVLVEFEGPATYDRYMDLKFHLEELLGRPVDLVTPSALRDRLRDTVEREAVRVA